MKARVDYFEFLPSRVFSNKNGVRSRGTQEPNFPPLMHRTPCPSPSPRKKSTYNDSSREVRKLKEKDGIQASLCPDLPFLTCQCFFKSKRFCGNIEPWAACGRLPSLWALSIFNSRRIEHVESQNSCVVLTVFLRHWNPERLSVLPKHAQQVLRNEQWTWDLFLTLHELTMADQ